MCRFGSIVVFTVLATVTSEAVLAQGAASADREAMYRKYLEFPAYLKGGKVEPRWMADGNRFWFEEDTRGGATIWLVDPQRRDKTQLINVNRLRHALTKVLGEQVPAQGVPFDTFDFTDESETAVRFRLMQRLFELDLKSHAITSIESSSQFKPVLLKAASKLGISTETLSALTVELKQRGMSSDVFLETLQRITESISQAENPDDEQKKLGLSAQAFSEKSPGGILDALRYAALKLRSRDRRSHVVRTSPNAAWEIIMRNHNLWARSVLDDREHQLTTDGSDRVVYDIEGIQDSCWSADNSHLVVRRYDLRTVPSDNRGAAEISMRPRSVLPPESLGLITDLFIIDILGRKQIPIDFTERSFWKIHIVGWRDTDIFFKRMRSYEKLDLMAASASGKLRNIVSEISMDGVSDLKERVTFVDDRTFIWESERDGANHLYLYDVQGHLIRRLTHGTFPIDRVMSVNEGWIYFTAHGQQEHPYLKQFYRVSVAGEGFQRLAANVAEVQFSPSKKYFIVSQSTPSQPSIVELRKADGAVVMEISKIDLDVLRDFQWSPPEVFAFKDADGESNLFGLIYKPFDFDPKKTYPVIDSIYGGHQMRTRYFRFPPQWGMYVYEQALAQMGYIVVVMDGRGYADRQVRDHVAGLKELAKQHSYIDLSRVGIFGISAGGNSTLWAMLTAPEFFQVGVATEFSVGRGRVEDDQVLKLADNLRGKLLLVHGDPHKEDAERMAKELIHANKFFDVLPIPGADHSLSGDGRDYHRYWYEAMRRYFEEHLN